jgi:hypothetical protein
MFRSHRGRQKKKYNKRKETKKKGIGTQDAWSKKSYAGLAAKKATNFWMHQSKLCRRGRGVVDEQFAAELEAGGFRDRCNSLRCGMTENFAGFTLFGFKNSEDKIFPTVFRITTQGSPRGATCVVKSVMEMGCSEIYTDTTSKQRGAGSFAQALRAHGHRRARRTPDPASGNTATEACTDAGLLCDPGEVPALSQDPVASEFALVGHISLTPGPTGRAARAGDRLPQHPAAEWWRL